MQNSAQGFIVVMTGSGPECGARSSFAMNRLCLCTFTCIVGTFSELVAQEIVREDAMEKLPLLPNAGAKTWAPAECVIEPSAAHVKTAASSWRWHVSVDHFEGEAKYPIGWPRAGHSIAEGPLRDWSGWDYLRMWIYTDTTRAALPREAAGFGLHTPDKAGGFNRPLNELRKGEWVEVRIPLSQIPRHQDVRHLQFHLSESNYQHGDQVDFYLNDVALLRHRSPTLLHFAAENAVMFADAQHIPVNFQLAGIAAGEQVAITCELHRDGRPVARIVTPAMRGSHRVVLDRGRNSLPAGDYELKAAVGGRPQPQVARIRFVESPWN